MSVKVSLNDPAKSILCIEFTERWHPAEYADAVRKAYRLIQGVKYPVDIIYFYPFNINNPLGDFWINFQQFIQGLPSNSGLVIAVGGREFAETVQTVFYRALRRLAGKVVLVNTLAEAETILSRFQIAVSLETN